MKIKKSLLEQIIKEETLKIQKVIKLKEERAQIVKQLNELYEEGGELEELQMPGFVKDIGASIGIVNYNNREDVKKYFNKEMEKVYSGKQKPNWATEGTPEYEKAIDAAIAMKNHQIIWSQSLGRFKPMSGTAIGGGITSTYEE